MTVGPRAAPPARPPCGPAPPGARPRRPRRCRTAPAAPMSPRGPRAAPGARGVGPRGEALRGRRARGPRGALTVQVVLQVHGGRHLRPRPRSGSARAGGAARGGGGAGAFSINESRALIGPSGGAGRRLDPPPGLPAGGLRAASRGSGSGFWIRGMGEPGLGTPPVLGARPFPRSRGPRLPPPPREDERGVRRGALGGRWRTCRWSAGAGEGPGPGDSGPGSFWRLR